MPVTLAVCTLRQQALDFPGNRDRILASIREAKSKGARFRVGPELEISGYGCWDHFLESDTFLHSWQVLADILRSDATDDIICDIGMPMVHRNVRYNCRIILFNRRIIMIRPKMVMADSGNYHESRWFSMWPRGRMEDFFLPRMIRNITGQSTVPFGEAVLATLDSCIGFEVCEEFWVANAPHTTMALMGVEIISNGSASHYEAGKLSEKFTMLQAALLKAGGVYLYANNVGCDGDRAYYDGASCIVSNGQLMAIGGHFSLQEVVVTTATVDLEEVRTFRGMKQSMSNQAQYVVNYPRIAINFALSSHSAHAYRAGGNAGARITPPIKWTTPDFVAETATAPALWLFDYLRLSGANGFYLALSGGLDSSSVALLVYRLSCLLAAEHERGGNTIVDRFLSERLRIEVPLTGPKAAAEICNRLLMTVYIATEHSGTTSRRLAAGLAEAIGSNHYYLDMDMIVSATKKVLADQLGLHPRHTTMGGSLSEDLALQNVQARLRLVLSYAMAQLMPTRSGIATGQRLVLATANASESLSGYFTKYDNSSGDLNPIASYSKMELRDFVMYIRDRPETDPSLSEILSHILDAVPTAELTPSTQSDEQDIGMTYEDLSHMGQLRQVKRFGPHSMLTRSEVPADAVHHFYRRYQTNRHKATSLPPAFHGTCCSPDDNRFDMRPILYPANWHCQQQGHNFGHSSRSKVADQGGRGDKPIEEGEPDEVEGIPGANI